MKNSVRVLANALMLLSIICMRCTTAPEELGIGRKAPGFKLMDLRGREVSLDQYKGRIVMLDFWATWCGPCRQSMPMLENLQKEFPDNLALLAINLQESAEEVSNYAKMRNIHSTILLDLDGKVGQVYRSDSIPMQVLVDQQGVVRHIQIGFGPSVQQKLRTEITKLLRTSAG
jgi:thiol-disulfide isomerase/thioredoxin